MNFYILHKKETTILAFYTNYLRLCTERGISPSAAALEIGIRKSNVTYWKNGRNRPSDITLSKIAAYFGVPVEELTSDADIKKEQSAEVDELSEPEKRLIELFRKLPKETQDSFPAFLEASLKAQGLL